MNYSELITKYPRFTFNKYKWIKTENEFKIYYEFLIGDKIKFTPKILINSNQVNFQSNLDTKTIDNLVFHLGLAEIPSYWKSTCSPTIYVKCGHLNKAQVDWWEKFIISEMGQFYFENKINYKRANFVKYLQNNRKNIVNYPVAKINGDKTLIPIGGGKDSVVTLELKKHTNPIAFMLNPQKSMVDVINLSGIDKTIKVIRNIDQSLLNLNKRGFLNGHTPIMSYISFLSIIVSYLYGIKNIALSNERSADEGSTQFLGETVNHQHDKSLEFEKSFRLYNHNFLSNANYYSFLRPLYEIQIMKIFAQMPKYLNVFRSCNIGQKENIWCNNCPKCLSTFLLMAVYLGTKRASNIFGENLLRKKSLKGTLKQLVGVKKYKPLECVGTYQEIKCAIKKIVDKDKIVLDKDILLVARRETCRLLKDFGDSNLSVEDKRLLKSFL